MESDHTVISLDYPIILYKATLPALLEAESSQNSNIHDMFSLVQHWLERLSQDVMRNVKCQLHWNSFHPKVSDLEDGRLECMYGVTLTGTLSQLYAARAGLLKNKPSQTSKPVCCHPELILNAQGFIKIHVAFALQSLMKESRSIILLDEQPLNLNFETKLDLDNICLEVYGPFEAVQKASLKLFVLLDELHGRHVATLDVDHRLHMIVGGRHRQDLIQLMRETNTHIYIPSPFIRIRQTSDSTKQETKLIYVTGCSLQEVHSVVERIKSATGIKQQQLIAKNLTCLPKKLDWILTAKKDNILKIMYENGTFIQLPVLGNNSNLVTVYGDSHVYVERTIRHLMLIACEFYVSCIQLTPSFRLNIGKDTAPVSYDKLSQISSETKTEIVFQKHFVEIYGLETGVKRAYCDITELVGLKEAIKDTKFQIELSLEHREFISGKKNGKINKIVKTVGCKILFQERFNDYNMLIDLYQPSPSKALEAFSLLEDELPAEISFYVPEIYHKRIIGVGGKSIQRIMKKHGVYVKFSNADEFASLGGYYSMSDNVIARTPSKNAENLYELKKDVLELLEDEESEATNRSIVTMSIPLHLYSWISNQDIHDIEEQTKSKITFNDIQYGGQEISIEGHEAAIQKAKSTLESILPHQVYFTCSSRLGDSVDDEQLINLLNNLSSQYSMTITFYHPMKSKEYMFVFVHRGDSMHLDQVRHEIQEWMKHQESAWPGSPLQNPADAPGTPRKQPMDSFYSFNSKLFAPMAGTTEQPHGFNYSLFDQPSTNPSAPLSKGLNSGKLTYSVPDLRQVFDDATRTYPESLFQQVPGSTIPTGQIPSGGQPGVNKSTSKPLQMGMYGTGASGSGTSGSLPESNSSGHARASNMTGTGSSSKGPIRLMTEGLVNTNSIDESPTLAASVDNLTLSNEETGKFRNIGAPPFQPSTGGGTIGKSPQNSVWGQPSAGYIRNKPGSVSNSSGGDVQVKVPSDKFCGLSLSRSVPDGLNDNVVDDQQQQQQQLAQQMKPENISVMGNFILDPSVGLQQPFQPQHHPQQPQQGSGAGAGGSVSQAGGQGPSLYVGFESSWKMDAPSNWFNNHPGMHHLSIPPGLSSPSNSDSMSINGKPISSPAHTMYYGHPPDPQQQQQQQGGMYHHPHQHFSQQPPQQSYHHHHHHSNSSDAQPVTSTVSLQQQTSPMGNPMFPNVFPQFGSNPVGLYSSVANNNSSIKHGIHTHSNNSGNSNNNGPSSAIHHAQQKSIKKREDGKNQQQQHRQQHYHTNTYQQNTMTSQPNTSNSSSTISMPMIGQHQDPSTPGNQHHTMENNSGNNNHNNQNTTTSNNNNNNGSRPVISYAFMAKKH